MPFDALTVSIDLVRHVRKPLELVTRRDADLAKQLRRAVSSVPLNVAEGRQRAGRDRGHLYRVALGSAAEVGSVLDVAVALGYVAEASLADARGSLDRVRAMLWKLTQ